MARPMRARADAVDYREDVEDDLASDDFAEPPGGRDQQLRAGAAMQGARVGAALKQQPSRRAGGDQQEVALQQRRASERATTAARPQYRCVFCVFVFVFVKSHAARALRRASRGARPLGV